MNKLCKVRFILAMIILLYDMTVGEDAHEDVNYKNGYIISTQAPPLASLHSPALHI